MIVIDDDVYDVLLRTILFLKLQKNEQKNED